MRSIADHVEATGTHHEGPADLPGRCAWEGRLDEALHHDLLGNARVSPAAAGPGASRSRPGRFHRGRSPLHGGLEVQPGRCIRREGRVSVLEIVERQVSEGLAVVFAELHESAGDVVCLSEWHTVSSRKSARLPW